MHVVIGCVACVDGRTSSITSKTKRPTYNKGVQPIIMPSKECSAHDNDVRVSETLVEITRHVVLF